MSTEKTVLLAKTIGALVIAAGAALGYVKSDDAQGDVASLLEQLDKRVAKQEQVINAQSEKLEKLARRMIFFQGHQAGVSAGALHEQNQQLERRVVELRTRRRPAAKVLNPARVARPLPSPAPPPMEQKIPRLHPKSFKKGK